MAFTFFFRDLHTLELAVDRALPAILGRSRPRVWDAGCATGQEPYSLAVLFSERLGHFAFRNLSIEATDLDETGKFEEIVRQGCYPRAELERIPADLREKYFEHVEYDRMRVCTALRDRIRFRRHNLLSLEPIGEGFSLIVCKNVLLHFSAEQRIEVIRMFHHALDPGGFLVMEQTQKLPGDAEVLFSQVVTDAQLFAKRRESSTFLPPSLAEHVSSAGSRPHKGLSL